MADWSDQRTRQRLADALLEHNGLATVVVDADWNVVFAAGAIEYVTGYAEAADLVGRHILDFVDPTDLEVALAGIATAELLGPDGDRVDVVGSPVAVRLIRADGRPATVTVSAAHLLHDPLVEGIALRVQLAHAQALIDRFVEELATDAPPDLALRCLAEALESSIPSAAVAIAVAHGDDAVVAHHGLDDRWIGALLELTPEGVPVHRQLTSKLGETVIVDLHAMGPRLAALAAGSGAYQVWAHAVATAESPERAAGCIVVVRYVPDELLFNHRQDLARAGRFVSLSAHQWEQDRRLRYAAEHDTLTGLPNRARFREELRRLDEHRSPYALLYLDLDGFKPVNDLHGHDVGDEALRCIADRLLECARADDLVARIGGDEFAVLAPGLRDADDVNGLRMRVETAFVDPLAIDGLELRVGASVGVAMSGDHERSTDVVQAADRAMYDEKRRRSA